ncbi:MAG: sporulation transcriptional regulator SpoIIID [[Eubacterium] rectale]|nr:sporulation transcriptional regulator SpoIIID [Agathobacter rectalis]
MQEYFLKSYIETRALRIDPELAAKARHILDINKSERHIRGGLATREKYLHLPHVHAG